MSAAEVGTENLVRIDLMKESLNVGQDGRADISLRDTQPREVRSQTTFSCTHGPLPFSQGSCSCRLCGRSAGPNGGGRQDLLSTTVCAAVLQFSHEARLSHG